MKGGYDASFPVFAAWALEFAPVNVSVVLVQPRGADFLCIGSRSWFFESLPDCVAKVQSGYPWRVSKHVLPPEEPPRIWEALFADLCVYNVEHAPNLQTGQRILLTQAFLSRLTIDTQPRPWDETNNAELLDSLSGYRVKELASEHDVYTTNVLGSHEQYLARALEHFAAREWKKPARGAAGWGRPPDYSKHDRSVIVGARR